MDEKPHRRHLFSTATLQRQVIACCCNRPKLLQVERVEFVDVDGATVAELLASHLSGDDPLILGDASLNVAALRVTFSVPIDRATLTAGLADDDPNTFSFRVETTWSRPPEPNLDFAPGRIEFDPESDRTASFRVDEQFERLREGTYTVTLYGTVDPDGHRPAIAAVGGERLDGEPTRLPSGDGIEGGDFRFEFIIHRVID